jgi:hypothetical protein
MLPDPGRYQERYRLTGSAALGLAASLVAVGLGIVGHTLASVMIAIALGFLAALVPAGDVVRVVRRLTAFRADYAGITLGAVPGKLAPARDSAVFVPWADVDQIVLYPAYPRGRGGYAQVRCIGIRRREGAPALSQDDEQAPGCPVPGVAAAAARRITGWRLDRERLAAVTAAVAPGILIVEASSGPSPGVGEPGRSASSIELGPARADPPMLCTGSIPSVRSDEGAQNGRRVYGSGL